MHRLAMRVFCGIVWFCQTGLAQNPAPRFEVASIREIVDGVRVMGGYQASGNRVEYLGFGIQALMSEAWNIRGDWVALGPGVDPKDVSPMMDQGRSARIYNIAAQAAEGTSPTRDEFRVMLRGLLAERFKLVTHTEKRDKKVYVLSVNGTAKLKESSGDGPCQRTGGRTAEGQTISARHCPMQTFLQNLLVDLPIYDETGLTGFYDFDYASALPFQRNDPLAISPFVAVRDFGLKLEEQQRPFDAIVIDQVEGPGEN